MTTTNDKMRARIIMLRDRARGTDNEHERTACLEKATELCGKYSIPLSILDAPTEQAPSTARRPGFTPPERRPGFTPPERRYPCRFGCGTFVQHTIDEMNACAERRRNETGSESAYAETPRRRASGSTFEDMFNDSFGQGFYNAGTAGHHERASYSTRGRRTGSENVYGGAKSEPRARATGSHVNCDHPATKSARAHCRKMRAAGF